MVEGAYHGGLVMGSQRLAGEQSLRRNNIAVLILVNMEEFGA